MSERICISGFYGARSLLRLTSIGMSTKATSSMVIRTAAWIVLSCAPVRA